MCVCVWYNPDAPPIYGQQHDLDGEEPRDLKAGCPLRRNAKPLIRLKKWRDGVLLIWCYFLLVAEPSWLAYRKSLCFAVAARI